MWLNTYTNTEQVEMINLAADLRQSVHKEFLDHQNQVAKERQKR